MPSSFRTLVLLVALTIGIAFFALGGHGKFDLSELKLAQQQLLAWQQSKPALTMLCFFLIFIVLGALSLPGAAILLLAAGACYGLGLGTLIGTLASVLGATCSMWLARYVFRAAAEKRYAPQLQKLDDAIAIDGVYYLLSLRLAPIIPYAPLNALLGLTRLRSWTFFWVSFIGMLPGTAVYVYAGQTLSEVQNLSDVFSLPIIACLLLLALLPWALRSVVRKLVPHAQ